MVFSSGIHFIINNLIFIIGNRNILGPNPTKQRLLSKIKAICSTSGSPGETTACSSAIRKNADIIVKGASDGKNAEQICKDMKAC